MAKLVQTGGVGLGTGLVLSVILCLSLFTYCCCKTMCCKKSCCHVLCFAHHGPGLSSQEGADKKRKLLLVYFVCFLVSMICMAAIAQGAAAGMDGLDKGFEESLLFVQTTQNKACSDAIDTSLAKGCSPQAKQVRDLECSDNSIDKYLSTGEKLVGGVLDFTVALSSSLTGSVSNNLNQAQVQTTAVNTSVTQIFDLLTQIQANAAVGHTRKTYERKILALYVLQLFDFRTSRPKHKT